MFNENDVCCFLLNILITIMNILIKGIYEANVGEKIDMEIFILMISEGRIRVNAEEEAFIAADQ